MKTILFKISFVLFFLYTGSTTFAQFNVLYLGKEGNTIDDAVQNYFTLEGYNVTFVSETDFGAAEFETANGYEGYDVLFISESIGSSSANNYGTAGFPIPCVITEGFVVKQGKLNILADDSETYHIQYHSDVLNADALTLVIKDNEHWITQEYDLDYNLVWAQADDATKIGITTFNLSDDIPDARPLGKFLFDTSPLNSFWAIPAGSMLHETTELPNMVIFGAIQSDVGGLAFSDEFLELLVRCIRWVTDDYENQIENINQKYRLVLGPNPTTGPVEISLTLPEAGMVTFNVYNISGKLARTVNTGNLNAGDNTVHLDFSDLPGSNYVFEIHTADGILRGKLIKQ